MTKLAAPLIIAGTVAKLPTLTPWAADAGTGRRAVTVTEGGRLSREGLREWATIGYVDGEDGPAITYEARGDAQGQTNDAGSIACEVLVGARDVPAARSRLFALLESWQAWLDDTTRSAGDLGLMVGSRLTLASDVTLTVTKNGGTATARVVITYTARTYG